MQAKRGERSGAVKQKIVRVRVKIGRNRREDVRSTKREREL